jgi:hypothetical protein
MKAVKRKFLVVDENLRLNKINDFQVVNYFDPNHFNLENTLNLHFDYSEGRGAKRIRVVAHYIDSSKNIATYRPIEFFEEFLIPFPLEGFTKKNEIAVALKLKEDSKFLWKIGIQILPKLETILHLSIT